MAEINNGHEGGGNDAMNAVNCPFEKARIKLIGISEDFGKLQEELRQRIEKENLLEEHKRKFEENKCKLQNIERIIKNDKMKVCLFGRTSSGKSSVINAMLHEAVLPCDVGETTTCFIEIQGHSEERRVLYVGNSNHPRGIEESADLVFGQELC